MMGAALAGAFVDRGHPTTVWNRSAARADALVARGASRAETVADAVSASEVIVLCVVDYDAAHAILDSVGDALSGRVLVNLTSGTPGQARATAEWAAERGVDYLDGAIMAVPQGIGRPGARVLFGGDKATLTALEPTLAAIGTAVHLGEDAGIAALYDLALLGIMWSTLSGFLHGTALVGTAGIEPKAFTRQAVEWLGAVGTFLPGFAAAVASGDFTTDVSRLSLNADGLDLLVRTSAEQGIGVEVPAPLRDLYARGVAEGHGEHAIASLIELIRRPAGA
ncbi:NAD(P)-dependent oxidoreductase [Solihabitans fulvus]|uniref:NAD(P)-dependent oxidoreductase n=2 Tax=Solihabitans fulvus TaxID=1892852 RepID=A0A5B2WQE0_9PSEU|nr:NAD(P)-dependent oxidoreductase [Solihabitans fulvus]